MSTPAVGLTSVDHLLFAVPNLESGMDQMEQLLGVRPVVGGRHPGFGTHNALLSLGPTTYLEVIARDPDLPAPEWGVLLGLNDATVPHLARWVLRCEPIAPRAAASTNAGLDLGEVKGGERQNPDGSWLRWRFTDPYVIPYDGAVPFLIEWGETPHPATTTPAAGTLEELLIEHPLNNEVQAALCVLGAQRPVAHAASSRLAARIASPRGTVLLR